MGTERFEVSRHTESTSAKAHPQHFNTSCLRNYRKGIFNLEGFFSLSLSLSILFAPLVLLLLK